MGEYLDLIGASGLTYRYMASDGRLSPMGGNFALVRDLTDGAWELLFAGVAESLSDGADTIHGEAVKEHGAAVRLYTRLNVANRTRQEEQDDIVQAYSPPMNKVRA